MDTLTMPEPIETWQASDIVSINMQGQVTIH